MLLLYDTVTIEQKLTPANLTEMSSVEFAYVVSRRHESVFSYTSTPP